MLMSADNDSGATCTVEPTTGRQDAVPVADIYKLSAGDVLFREGDARHYVFRVEKGSVCLYKAGPNGEPDIVEFAFPGDLVGRGIVNNHDTTAQATVETSVRCLPCSGFTETIESDAATTMESDASTLGELRADPDRVAKPLERTAAFLFTLSRINAYEGRDPSLITDSMTCGVAADYLGMSVEDLATQLRALETRGLVAPADEGLLRLTDLESLEKMVDAA